VSASRRPLSSPLVGRDNQSPAFVAEQQSEIEHRAGAHNH
jgi:hypothetical protein